jgi:hypothetical protein
MLHHPLRRPRASSREPSRSKTTTRRAALVTLGHAGLAVAAVCLLRSPANADAPRRIPLILHIAQRDGAPVAPESFIGEQLAAANSIYRPLGIELVATGRVPLGAEHAEMITRSDRDALARHAKKGAIHVFIVAKLMDVDEPGRERRGVHWHPRPSPRDSYLIVSQISGPYVLAHELGHMLGNPRHSDVPGNLMCYTRGEGTPFLDDTQIRRVRRALAALLKEGRIVALPSEPPAQR